MFFSCFYSRFLIGTHFVRFVFASVRSSPGISTFRRLLIISFHNL
mgnify:CR=1 FL=1